MSEEAKKKVSTAARQAKHAVNNIEEAAELQAAEVVNEVIDVIPLSQRAKPVAAGAVLGVAVSIGGYFAGRKVKQTWEQRSLKKQAKKDMLHGVVSETATPHIRTDKGEAA